ncbi:hypothetical protein SNEBB_001434 [Seison nebaliae]|nr:hypothetical protein SNEBB_001434 [Seison nebaliae]
MMNFVTNPIYQQCYMDIEFGGHYIGRLEFQLYDDITPKTTANFAYLCRHNHYGYREVEFLKVIPGFALQSEHVIINRKTKCLYGEHFRNENYIKSHNRRGLLSMMSLAPDKPFSSSSAFFITLGPCEWLDGKNVVFGEMILGHTVLQKIEKEVLNNLRKKKKTLPKIRIINCGRKPFRRPNYSMK